MTARFYDRLSAWHRSDCPALLTAAYGALPCICVGEHEPRPFNRRQRIAVIRQPRVLDAAGDAALITLIARVLHRATPEQRDAVRWRVVELGECVNHAVAAIAGVAVADCGGDEDPAAVGERFDRCCGGEP